MKILFALFLLVAIVASQATLETTAVYTIDGCIPEYTHDCYAYFCMDSDQHAQMLISATTVVMGSPVSENYTAFSGIAVWGYTTADISSEPDNAVAEWIDTSNGADWSSISLNITYRVGSVVSYSEIYNLTLDAQRAFVGAETCLWFPESNGYYDGKFSISLGTGEAFSFYVCGDFEGETFAQFYGQAYGGLTIPFGPGIDMEYFINITGYFVEYNGRRFYHGFTTISTASQDGGDCDPESGFIFEPRTNPLLIAVTNNSVAGTIEGWTTSADISGGFPDGITSVTITGSPEEVVAKPKFCLTSPEYLTVCEGIDPYSTEPVAITTTTYEVIADTTTIVVEEATTITEETENGDDDNSVSLFLPALSLIVLSVFQ